jgi:hypothetical protein
LQAVSAFELQSYNLRLGAYDNSISRTQDAVILFDALEDSAARRLNFALRLGLKPGIIVGVTAAGETHLPDAPYRLT